jgi:predicted amidohydrolase YtcJ
MLAFMFKTASRVLGAPIMLASLATGSGASVAATLEADLVLWGGKVYTPSGWTQALAVQDGVLIAVGDEAAVDAYRTDDTQIIDLRGATVLPGLHDMHVHPMGAGLMQSQCLFPQGSTSREIEAAIAACAEARAEAEWIVGGQWDATSFGTEPIDRTLLDRAAPRNPVALVDISGHSLWVSSQALESAGITAATPNPPGGIIERDADGRITGVLRESASGLVRRLIPPATAEQTVEALRWSLDLMLSYGITSFTDAGVDATALSAYAALADRGALKQRVKACMMWRRTAFGGNDADTPDYVAERNLYARDRLSPTCVKLVLDGVPTDGHTAAMVEPYADAEGLDGDRATGLLMVPAETLNALVTELDGLGFTVKMHAAGDAAVRAGLDAIEAAREANGFSGHLHEVAHNSFVQVSDIRRARGIAATFEMSPYIWYPNPIIPDIAKAVGSERMQRWIPLKDALDAGALVVPGSDWSVVPSVNPWIAIETLVTRQVPGGGGEELGAAERITLAQAIELFTASAAREMGNRSRVGTIERGMLADLVVIDRNPFEVPITDVHATTVLMTMIDGEIVYRAADAPR